MEGFDKPKMDEILGLEKLCLKSVAYYPSVIEMKAVIGLSILKR
jgi:hypothetical protein